MREQDDTAARLVTAAERLFAEGGEEATSLRAVARAARASAAAVHYHFGGRDELLRAVLDRHLGPLNARRQALLQAQPDPVTVAAVLGAALRPDLELLAKLRKKRVEVARFLGRAHTLPGPAVTGYLTGQFDEFARAFLPPLQRCLPELGRPELRLRLRLVGAAVAIQFATAPPPGQTGPLGADDVDEQVRRLVAFCAAGVAAPPAAPPPRRKRV